MKLLSALFLCMALSIQLGYTQFDSLNFNSFQLTDLVRHQFDIRPSFSSKGTWDRQNDVNPGLQEQVFQTDVLASLTGTYSFLRNTRRQQQTLRINVGGVPQLSNTDSENDRRQSRGDWLFDVQGEQRWYNTRNQFLEVGPEIRTSLRQATLRGDAGTQNSKNGALQVEVPILVGKGRLERIDDARMAVFILEQLLVENRLSQIPGEAEIREFTALISRLRNQRFFDSRHKRIYELEMLDAFLQDEQLSTGMDARYFTTIADNWGYAINPYRETGRRFSVGAVPGWQSIHNKSVSKPAQGPDQESEFRWKRWQMGAMVNYISAKAIDLYWHRLWSATVQYFPIYEAFNGTAATDSLWRIEAEADLRYEVFWHPTSRTLMQATAFSNVAHLANRPGVGDPQIKTWRMQIGVEGNLNYYIAPHIRLAVNGELGYNFQRRDTNLPMGGDSFLSGQQVRYAVDAGLLYSLM